MGTDIRKSYLSVWWYAIWSIILLEIPMIVRLIKIKTRHYSYDTKNLYVEEGVFSKHSISIPLIKIESVQAETNIFGNGNIIVNSKVAGAAHESFQKLEFIRNSRRAQKDLMLAIDASKESQSVRTTDVF